MAGKKTTGSIHNAYKDHGTSTKDWYTSVNISSIKTALDGVLPTRYRIKSLKIHIATSFTCKWDARVYIQAGLSTSTSSIGQTILEEKQIGTMDTSGSETYTRDITSYLSSTESSAIKTNHGSYLVFRMQSDNIFKKTFTINSVTLEVEWYDYYTATFKNGETVLQTVSILEGSTPSYTGATPTKEEDVQYSYVFSGWSPSVGAINGNTTYTAQFIAVLRNYYINVQYDVNEGAVTGAESPYYEYGTTLTLTAIPKDGYVFDRWVFAYCLDENVNLYDNPMSFTVLGGESVRALFKATTNNILIDTVKPKKILIDNQEVKAIFVDTTKVYG